MLTFPSLDSPTLLSNHVTKARPSLLPGEEMAACPIFESTQWQGLPSLAPCVTD